MKIRLLCAILLLGMVSHAQTERVYPQYPSPVDYQYSLSATFGELRSNAFHAGVDIKTGGIGKKVYAVADGYVCRISVSPYGYGKAVYITHNDGFMSVYAHLDGFNDVISEYVKMKQYETKSFKQNLFLEHGEIPVKCGEIIGFSGDSGSSGGPHLHYELRDAACQHPLDPFLFGVKINDKTNPTINGIAVYPSDYASVDGLDTVSFYNLTCENGIFSPKQGEIKVNGKVYFGVSVTDQTAGLSHKYGVDNVKLYADDRLIFSIVFDEYSYDETRYVNSLIDYAKFVREKKRYIRTEIDEYNILSLYGERNGYIIIDEGDRVKMKYVIEDKSGNVSTAKFTLVGDKHVTKFRKRDYDDSCHFVDGKSQVEIDLKGFKAKIPVKAFYRAEYVQARQRPAGEKFASDYIYVLGSEDIPVQKSIELSLTPSEKYSSSSQLYVASISKDGKLSSQGGNIADGKVVAKVRSFGEFALAIDSISPSVNPMNFSDKGSVSECKYLKIKIKDSETGINKFDVFVNGDWVIGDYDAKNNLLSFEVDGHFRKGNNTISVIITDGVNNETCKSYKVIY